MFENNISFPELLKVASEKIGINLKYLNNDYTNIIDNSSVYFEYNNTNYCVEKLESGNYYITKFVNDCWYFLCYAKEE